MGTSILDRVRFVNRADVRAHFELDGGRLERKHA